MNINQLIVRSAIELNAASAGEPLQPEVLAFGLDTLNMILDQFNATDNKLYADLFSTYTIPDVFLGDPNPIPIGPTGTWVYPIARPQDIPAASVILTSVAAPRPYITLVKLTTQQWQALPTPTLRSSLPNAFYYNPTVPNGSFYFWTVQTTANQVQIQTRQMLAQVAANTTFAQPPGYYYALMMMLARAMKSGLRKPWMPEQEQLTKEACLIAFGGNGPDLLYATADLGMPVSGADSGRRGDYNYLTGQIVP